jgi:YVTN family beta-propeller protein
MCKDRERCLNDPNALQTFNFGGISSGGHFTIALDPEMIEGATLVYEADVEPATSTKYRVINFGSIGTGAGAGIDEEVVIDPNTEAAVQLIDDSGLENFSDEGVEMIIETVQTANADLTFAGLDANAAVTMAASEASQDPAVMMAIEEAMVTPTPTPTLTPTVTPTPIPRFVLVTNVDERTVSIIDGRMNIVLDDIAVGPDPIGIALTADGEHAFVVNRGAAETEGFSIIETRTRSEVRRFDDYEPDVPDDPLGVAITPLGLAYVANRASESVDVINVDLALTDPSSARVTRIMGVGVHPSLIAAARSEPFVYVTLVEGRGVAVIDTSSNGVVKTVNLPDQAFAVALSPDDQTVWVTRAPSTVEVINAVLARTNPSSAVTGSIEVGESPLGIAVAPAGDFVYVANADSGSVSVIEVASQSVVKTVPLTPGSVPTSIAITSDGLTAYVALSEAGMLAVVSTEKARTDPGNAVTTTIPVGAHPQVVVVTDLP